MACRREPPLTEVDCDEPRWLKAARWSRKTRSTVSHHHIYIIFLQASSKQQFKHIQTPCICFIFVSTWPAKIINSRVLENMKKRQQPSYLLISPSWTSRTLCCKSSNINWWSVRSYGRDWNIQISNGRKVGIIIAYEIISYRISLHFILVSLISCHSSSCHVRSCHLISLFAESDWMESSAIIGDSWETLPFGSVWHSWWSPPHEDWRRKPVDVRQFGILFGHLKIHTIRTPKPIAWSSLKRSPFSVVSGIRHWKGWMCHTCNFH